MRFKSIVKVLVLFLVALVGAGVSMAQTSNGAIAGTVSDKTGAVVPNAQVSVRSTDLGGPARTAETGSVGSYRIEALLPGIYSVTIEIGGFQTVQINNVVVKASLTTTVDATLEVASTKSTVTVEASAAQQLQTQSGSLSANISPTEVHELPIQGLNPIALVLTYAGVNEDNGHGFSNGVDFSVNGTRPRSNNFLIDGQDNNDNAINGQAFQPSNTEAISQVTVLTNSYSSEFGRGGGSVTNVIYKGGTNDFHGSAWELANNSALWAIPADAGHAGVTKNPVQIENTFGFAVGGPIKHNKLFAFGSSQWDRFRSTNDGSTLHLPTAASIATLQSLLPNPNVQFLLSAFNGIVGADPGGPACGNVGALNCIALGVDPTTGTDRGFIQTGLVQRSGIAEAQNDRQWDVRVDYVASEKDSLMGRYFRDDSALSPDLFNFPSQLPPFDSQQGGPSQSVAAAWTHVISPNVVNELRASYTNIGFTFGPTPATAANPLAALPTVSITGSSFPGLGFPSALPQGRAHKSFQYQEALNYSVRNHTFKGGVDIVHLSVVDQIPFNSRGTESFAASPANGTTPAYTGLGNYIDNFTGNAGTLAKVFGNPTLQPFWTTFAPYIEDTWRMRPNFTLTLGVRYEYLGVPENTLQFPAINASLGFGLPGESFPAVYQHQQIPDRNNFGPRVGFAYTPHFGGWLFGQDKTVIRAGFGMFYDQTFTNILDNTGGTSPNAVGGTLVGSSNAATPRGIANATGQLNAIAPLLNPLAGVNTITNNNVNPLTNQWNFDIQRELGAGFVVTAAYVGTRGERLYVNQQYNPRILGGARINPALGPVTVRTNAGDSIYHAGQLTVERKFSRGLLLRGAYTYSKLIDDGSEVFTTTGTSSFSQDPFCQRCDRGPSAYDRRHRFVATYVWDVPSVHSSGGAFAILHWVTRDWQTAGFFTIESGIPGTISTGVDSLGDGNAFNDRPSTANASLDQFDINRYSTPAANSGILGNVGRNTAYGPGQIFWDTQLQRTFKIPLRHMEQQALTFRGEFYNVMNHPNLTLPDTFLADGPGVFGNLGDTIFGGRQIKISLKYQF